jgi:hypothetical protein
VLRGLERQGWLAVFLDRRVERCARAERSKRQGLP